MKSPCFLLMFFIVKTTWWFTFLLCALSFFLISFVSQVDLLMLLAPILQIHHIIWSSKASIQSLNNVLLWLPLFFTAKITDLSVWLPHILSVWNELKETSIPIPCGETGNLLEYTVVDAGIGINYRSDVELREEPEKILPWLKSNLWTLCGGG